MSRGGRIEEGTCWMSFQRGYNKYFPGCVIIDSLELLRGVCSGSSHRGVHHFVHYHFSKESIAEDYQRDLASLWSSANVNEVAAACSTTVP